MDSGTIYAVTGGGLSISTNNGSSFINKTTADGLGDNNAYGVYVNSSGIIYVATWRGLSISTVSSPPPISASIALDVKKPALFFSSERKFK